MTATDGGRHGRKALFTLLAGLGEPAPPNLRELFDETLERRDRARRERGERRCRQLDLTEREHDLADGRCMTDTRPAELRNALHDRGAVREVDGDRVVLARGGERRRLPRLAHERLQVRMGEGPQVETAQDGVTELDQPQRQPIPAGLRHVLDEPSRGERGQQTGHRARVDARAPRDLVRSELPSVGEGVEHRERALDGSDVADGWLTGASHDTLLSHNFDMPLPGRQ